jgi:formate C-acetyltransferase
MQMLEQQIRSPEWALTADEAQALEAHQQYFAAGFMIGADVSIPMRHARGIANYLDKCDLPPYKGELLYPAERGIWAAAAPQVFWHHYVALDLTLNPSLAAEKAAAAADPVQRRAFEKAQRFCEAYPRGGGYTHSIINFGRALREGLDAYEARVRRLLAAADDPGKQELYRALLVVLAAVDRYRERIADHLASCSFSDPTRENNRRRLADAYHSRLPMRPAHGFFEAMVATIFLYALDGSDDLGRFDQFMWPYYRGDLAAGEVRHDEAVGLIRTLWRYVDRCCGWNVALGGSARDGEEASNELTVLCLEAGRGMRRPNLAIRLRRDTPQAVWDGVIDTLAVGGGLPALYCEENYLRALDMAQLNLPDEDKRDFAFGGCTEIMIHGCSNVGSLDGDFSVIKTLEESLHRHLPGCATFDDFLAAFEADLRAGIAELTAAVSRNQELRATYHPQLIRTILIDDCVDRGKNYYDGGARYNWSVINIVGLSNAIDSLTAVRTAVYDQHRVSAGDVLAALRANFEGHDTLRRYLERCPRFGNDDPEVNALANRLSGAVYREFKRYAPWRGGKFLCGTLMFVTYGWFGRPVGATPDGRLAGTPVADSAGPVQGRDTHGPTACLRSVASLHQVHAPGTLVVNLRLSKELFATPRGRAKLQSLIRGYFDLGGMQLQVNVVDQEVLRDAIAHPERHGDLIVRVGGYSEYFNALDDDLKRTILERVEHQ